MSTGFAEATEQASSDLVLDNLHLASRTAKKLLRRFPGRSSLTYDDLYQAGLIGLIQAAERWDPSLNPSFRLYAIMRVHGAVVDEARATIGRVIVYGKKVRKTDYVEETLRPPCLPLEDWEEHPKRHWTPYLLPSPEDEVVSDLFPTQLAEGIRAGIADWPVDDRLYVEWVVLEGKTSVSLAEAEGVTGGAITHRSRHIMTRLRNLVTSLLAD